MIKEEDLFKIGNFAKPHGVKGELSLLTDYDLTVLGDEAFLFCRIDGICVPFFIEDFRYKSDSVALVKLEKIDTEKAASRLSGSDVFIDQEIEETDEPETDWINLIGFKVIDRHQGTLGIVTDVDDSTLNILMKIDHNGEELLIPAADGLIEQIDDCNKCIFMHLPDGLMQL